MRTGLVLVVQEVTGQLLALIFSLPIVFCKPVYVVFCVFKNISLYYLLQNVKHNDNIVTKNRSGMCSLIIREVTLGDTGDYSCKAVNEDGEDEISAKVTVKGKNAWLPWIHFSCSFIESYTLWRTMTHSLNSPEKKYKLNLYKRFDWSWNVLGWRHWIKVHISEYCISIVFFLCISPRVL